MVAAMTITTDVNVPTMQPHFMTEQHPTGEFHPSGGPRATGELPRPGPRKLARAHLADGLRAFGVTYGPSALLDLTALTSVGVTVRRGLSWRRGNAGPCGKARAIEPLAWLVASLTAAYLLIGRPRLRRWGATDDEVTDPQPGDALVPHPAIESTWAVTVNAPASAVWPWLAQMGQDRGGFYSYDWLENLAGCRLRNADRIHPEWQQRTVGEIVPLHPMAGLKLTIFEPGAVYALEGWGAFILDPVDEHTTRLITRSRVPSGWPAFTYAWLMEIPHFIM